MIFLIGHCPNNSNPGIEVKDLSAMDEFAEWIKRQNIYQLDIETDITPYWSTKKLITLQFGSEDGNTIWILQYSFLNNEAREQLKALMENPAQIKLIHNGMFEAIVLKFHGITIENIYDTMLVEQILTAGMYDSKHDVGGNYGLKDLTLKYVTKTISKEEQLTFGDDILTNNKIVYAAEDVTNLGAIRRMQITELTHHDLDWVAALEHEALLSYSEMTYNGLELNTTAWRANMTLAQPIVDQAKKNLDNWLQDSTFYHKAVELGYISDTDRIEIKWTSPKTREYLLKLFYPDIPGGSLGVVKKYAAGKDDPILNGYLNKDYSLLEQAALLSFKNELIEKGWIIPANTVVINWGSQQQVLPLFRQFAPKLKDLSADSIAKVTHPITKDYEEYKDSLKLLSSYGEEFITKFVEPDGKVRTSYRQILSTGRVSSSRPNMQQIPAKESVGAIYRNAFVTDPGWVFVDSDFSSQELNIIAYLSKDPVWQQALQNGEDLHSVAAEVVYGPKWKAAAEETCEYYHKGHQKCKCKRHKVMRQNVKTINFGLAYGMGDMKLAGTLKITLPEAKQLIVDYFKAFPKIGSMLNYLGRFGVERGYSMTMAPFFRKRWYPYWSIAKHYIPAHLSGIEYNPTLGSIERAAKNAPIQGTGADMLKYAGVLIRRYIRANGLQDSIKQVVHVHDQITTTCKAELAEWWKPKLTELMEEAALLIIPNGMLKAETNISPVWSK